MAAINATLSGDATWNASTQDGSAYCLELSGAGHASASHDAKLNLANSFAILFRFKTKSTSQASKYLLSKLDSGGTNNNWSILYAYVNSAYVDFYAASFTGSSPNTAGKYSITDTNWHAIAFRYNGTEWASWLDGTKSIISSSITFSLSSSGTNNLFFGSFNGSANRTSCCLDDIQIYSSGNLPSDAEIAAWQTSYTQPSSANPVARWQFNEGSGATAADSGIESSPLTIAAFCEDYNQMEEFQLSQTSRPITFAMRHSSTGMLVTGATVTAQLSKNGAAYAAAAGTTGQMTLGSYSISPSATDFNTLGSLKLIATAANCLTTYKEMMVVQHSPTTGLPSVASGLPGGLIVASAGSGTGSVVLTAGGATYSVDAAGVNIATASSIPTLSGIASTVAANVPTNAQIASTVAANVPTNAQIAATVAANLPTNASIASTVAAVVPTNASIASTVAAVVPTNTSIAATVAAAITADHGSGNYATATALAAAQSSINTLATTSQLASSSATLLAAIPSISTLATTSQLAASSAALLTQVNLAIATSAAILDDTGNSGVVVAAASKTGYALASDGLDTISTTAPSGVATNFRQMVVQTWRRLFKKATLTSTQLKTYADDGTTVVTTQTVTNTGGTETVGNAS